MKRFIVALAAVAALGASVTGVAQAATPTVVTEGATRITNTSVVLHARVDPHGVGTDYTFNYGPTPAYGASTVARSAGTGTKRIAVAEQVTGLSPGTVYHYQVVGVSAAGQVAGADATFTTAGTPPPAVATGPPVNVRKTVASPTGAINPNGISTGWYVQYGLSTAYGLQTFPQPALAPGFSALPVSLQLVGLAPATLFHYRVVAYHGAATTYGVDATFFTQPDHPPSANMTTKTSPSSDRSSPYTFTTSGSLKGGTSIPAAQRCSGSVGIRYYNGRHELASVVAHVGSHCTFAGKVSFKKTRGKGSVALRVSVFYRGNGYLASQSKTDHPHAGR